MANVHLRWDHQFVLLTSTSEILLTLSLKGLPLMCWSYRRRANEKSPSLGITYTNS